MIIMILISWIPDNASHFQDDTACQFSGLLRYARNDAGAAATGPRGYRIMKKRNVLDKINLSAILNS
jgi:hypothetical protein